MRGGAAASFVRLLAGKCILLMLQIKHPNRHVLWETRFLSFLQQNLFSLFKPQCQVVGEKKYDFLPSNAIA
jgi:hypothetical protein